MVINCIAVDDEPLALEKIKEYVKRICYLNLQGCFSNGADALLFLKNNNVDLIYLDIQMEIISGIELMESLQNKPRVIFTTAYDKYAIKAFELDVIDYLLKPISFSRFLKAAEKVYSRINIKHQKQSEVIQNSIEENKDFFFVKSGSSTVKINFEDILYVEGMKDYLAIQTIDSKTLTLLNFNKIEQILTSNKFIRIHRSFIISIKHINKIETNQVKIRNRKIPIGGFYKRAFIEMVEKKKLI